MSHVILLGDSIFDNASYVAGGPAVIDHLRSVLPAPWKGTLLAVDGACTPDVARQLEGLPADGTHLVVSAGGNDALSISAVLLGEPVTTVLAALGKVALVRDEFRRRYRQMLEQVRRREWPVTVCTVYHSVPGLHPAELAGLSVFNDVITSEAFRAGLSLIDLRVICGEAGDYSSISPIEPSVAGGAKIARAIVRAVTGTEGGRVIA